MTSVYNAPSNIYIYISDMPDTNNSSPQVILNYLGTR